MRSLLITTFLTAVNPCWGDLAVSRDYVSGAKQACIRLLSLNTIGAPLFLAGYSRGIFWTAGPFEGMWRRWGEGYSSYGQVDMRVSRPLEVVRDETSTYSRPKFGEGWGYFTVSINGIVGYLAINDGVIAKWLDGFADLPGIKVNVTPVENSNSSNVSISVQAEKLPERDRFNSIVQTLVSRIMKDVRPFPSANRD